MTKGFEEAGSGNQTEVAAQQDAEGAVAEELGYTISPEAVAGAVELGTSSLYLGMAHGRAAWGLMHEPDQTERKRKLNDERTENTVGIRLFQALDLLAPRTDGISWFDITQTEAQTRLRALIQEEKALRRSQTP